MKSPVKILKKSNKTFEGQEKEEKTILLLRKHPFVILLPLNLILLLGLVPIIIFLVFYSFIVGSMYFMLFLFLASIFYSIIWLLSFYYLTMYTLNTVTVTNKRIIDRDQHGFFNQEVSELHLYRVQDVTIHTVGVIKTFLSFGNVIVQTAASEHEFAFHDVPRPNEVKDTIMKIISSNRESHVEEKRGVYTEQSRGVNNSKN